MVLNYYGVAITQNQIVARTYGRDESDSELSGNLQNHSQEFKQLEL